MDLSPETLEKTIASLEALIEADEQGVAATDEGQRERFLRVHAASRMLRGLPATAPRGSTINVEASATGIRLTCYGVEDAFVPSWAFELLERLIPLVNTAKDDAEAPDGEGR